MSAEKWWACNFWKKPKKTGHLGYLCRFDIYLWVTAKRSPVALWGRYFWLMFWKSAGGWNRKKKSTCCSLKNTCKQIKKVYRRNRKCIAKRPTLFNVMSKREIKRGGTKLFPLIVHWKSRSLLICYCLTLKKMLLDSFYHKCEQHSTPLYKYGVTWKSRVNSLLL